jgi:hypothetical protein
LFLDARDFVDVDRYSFGCVVGNGSWKGVKPLFDVVGADLRLGSLVDIWNLEFSCGVGKLPAGCEGCGDLGEGNEELTTRRY